MLKQNIAKLFIVFLISVLTAIFIILMPVYYKPVALDSTPKKELNEIQIKALTNESMTLEELDFLESESKKTVEEMNEKIKEDPLKFIKEQNIDLNKKTIHIRTLAITSLIWLTVILILNFFKLLKNSSEKIIFSLGACLLLFIKSDYLTLFLVMLPSLLLVPLLFKRNA